MDALGPLLIALTALPALGIAAWQARAAAVDPKARGLALRWAGIALAMFAGAIGLYFAGGRGGATAVALLMVVVVNVLLVSMLLHLRGRRRD
ncbi:hypothetical protein QF205_16690 [Luteimonas composti]|uniref:DUF3325 domain-containing protein n=1 Tax=Luteimonas composti TaxID=398257 RepID=A0ABT6MW51_9GAMM|nr:hypothetical protein [Luteimonas composti]MDH7454689.1 hypothetical protein [Luteimonas composti]